MTSVVNVSATGNAEIDGLLIGTKWNGPITYSFPDSPGDYPAGYGNGEPTAAGFVQAPAAMQQAVNYALASVMGFTNLSISYAGTDGADIRVAQSSAANPTSYAYYPSNSADGSGGDVWFGTLYNYSAAALGNYYFATAVHELGHALGLKHSQETGGVANVAVPAAHDDLEFSIMSYRSYQGGPLTGYTNEAYGYPQSYMANDILALQTLYGANYNTHSENTVYSWSPTTGQEFINGVAQLAPGRGVGGSANRIFETVWDGNGIDTYDLSNYTTGVSINLNPGASSVTSAAQLANLGNGHYAQGNIYNAYQVNGDRRSLIDNANGGTGNDVLIGNTIANVLNGGGGNDTLIGGGGNDTIIGGSGTDAAVYSGNRANYLVTYNAATQTFTVADQRVGTPDGTDTVTGVENFQFADRTVASTVVANHPPVVTVANVSATVHQSFSASSLFSVTDADGDAITEYQFYDGPVATGHFTVNGVVQGFNQIVDVSAAQLAQTTFTAGPGTDDVYVRAFDGFNWSVESGNWTMFHVTAPVNHAPVVTVANVNVTVGQIFAASSLFSVTDADGDAITEYQFYDGPVATGHFTVNGVVQGINQIVDVSAAQLSQTTFTAGPSTDDVYVRAFDGTNWSVENGNWTMFHVTAPVNHAPVVTVANVNATVGQIFAASSLFSVTDADGDPITEYQFYDGPMATGHFTVNGVVQGINQIVDVSAAQLAQTTFTAGPGTDNVYVRAFDGNNWSVENGNWTMFHATAPVNHAPVVTVANVNATVGQSFAASSLFSVTDADSDTITKYQFYDGPAGTGHFTVNGVVQATNQIIDVSAAQLAQTTFAAGPGTDDVYVRAFDGNNWSVENGNWTMFHVTAPAASAPTVGPDPSVLWTTSTNGDSFHFHSLSQGNTPSHDEPFLGPASSHNRFQGSPEPSADLKTAHDSVGMLDALVHTDPVWWNLAHTDHLV
jgi:predicted Fe-Mo cluster-binding NifX family protein